MSGFSGFNTKLWVQDDDDALVRIGEIMDVTGPEMTITDVDITSNDSKANTKQYIASLIAGGDLTFTMLFDEDRYESMKTRFDNRRVVKMILQLPTEPYNLVTSMGYTKSWGNAMPMEEAVVADISFMVTGVVRFIPQIVKFEVTADERVIADTDPVMAGAQRLERVGYETYTDAMNMPATLGSISGDDGSDIEIADILQCYWNAVSDELLIDLGVDAGNTSLTLPWGVAGDFPTEFYVRIGENAMYRSGMDGAAEPTTTNYQFQLGDPALTAAPLVDGENQTFVVFGKAND